MRGLCCQIFLLVFLLLSVCADARASDLAARGLWNGFLNQTNIVECVNLQSTEVRLLVQLFDQSGGLKKGYRDVLPPHATRHFILDRSEIADQYGTYEASVENSFVSEGGLVRCFTAVYRFRLDGQEPSPEYAYVLPSLRSLTGTNVGIYNSMNPTGGSQPVLNWLSVMNFGDSTFEADLEVYPLGATEPTLRLPLSLSANSRSDLALGHSDGQGLGIYRIVPRDSTQSYAATLMRYGERSGGAFDFAFPLHAKTGSCDSGPLVASTMGPSRNWLEIGNGAPQSRDARIEVRNSEGLLVRTEERRIPPFGQYHLLVNEFLGELRTGSLRVRCLSPDSDGRLIAQSSYYGLHPNGELAWSYSSQGLFPSERRSCGRLFSVNTYLGAANWFKSLNSTAESVPVDATLYDANGIERNLAPQAALPPFAATDSGIHETVLQNFTGTLLSSPQGDRNVLGSMLRVYPNSSGGIATILEDPGFPLSCPESFLSDFASTPDKWAELLSHPEFRRSVDGSAAGGDHVEHLLDYKSQPIDIVVHSPRLGASPREIVVQAPGAPNYSAYRAIALAVSSARQGGPAIIRFPAGEYVIDPGNASSHADFSGLSDVLVTGAEATLVFTNPLRTGVFIRGAKRLAFSGLRLDWNYQNSVAVDVVGSPTNANYRELQTVDGSAIDPTEYDALYTFDYLAKRWVAYQNGQRYLFSANDPLTEIAPGRYTHPQLFRVTANRRALLLRSRVGKASTIVLRGTDTEDLSFDEMRFWNSPQMSIHASGLRGLRISNSRLEVSPRSPTQLISARADGFHIGGVKGDVIIENNTISGQGDDGINVRGIDFEVSEVHPDNHSIVLNLNNPHQANRPVELESFEVGDLISISDEGQMPLSAFRVAEISASSNTSITLRLEQPDWVSLDTEFAKLEPLQRGFNLSKSSSRYLVRNNIFQNNAGRGMLLSAPNGVIVDNEIDSPNYSGMLLASFNGAFFDGPGPVNVAVQTNHLKKTNNRGGERDKPAGAISAYAEEVDFPATFPTVQRVLFENNLIEDVEGLAIQISNSRSVKVLSNVIDHANQLPFASPLPGDSTVPQGSIMIEKTCNGSIFGNSRVLGGNTAGLFVDPLSTCNISAQGNY